MSDVGAGSGRRVIGRSDGPSPSASAPTGRKVLGRSDGGQVDEPIAAPDRSASDRRSRRRRVRRLWLVAIVAIALLVVVPTALFAVGWWRWSALPTVDVASALSPRNGRVGTNYLVVGTDSREGIAASDPNAAAFLAGEVAGARTDTILVLHVEGSGATITSIPRDLWVTDPATGQKGRINATFAKGPGNLIRAVTALGIPVDHYFQIDFVSFGHLVDSLGGITIDFAHPARDIHSGFGVDVAGPVRLDGVQALAYVRSRYYEEGIDGKWRMDPTADLGRTIRQRAFADALLRKATSVRNPFVLFGLPGAIGAGFVHDSTFGYPDAVGFAWSMRDTDPEPVALPSVPRRTSGGADVLELGPGSGAVIASLAT